MIEYVASKGKPIILSTGIAEIEDIELAIDACKRMGNDDIALLKCTSSYPAPIEEANMIMVQDLATRFGVISGLSDHTMGATVPVVATCFGAKIIEKHFILDREIGGPDASFSMNEEEFTAMVKAIREAEKAIGVVDYTLTEKQAKGKDSIAQKQKLNYYVFDFMPYEMWINEKCPLTQIERTEIIRKSIDNLKTTKIKNANGRMLNNEQEAIAFYKEALSLGFEGLILKSLDGLYCWNMTSGTRGSEWLKWKPTIDVDLTIIGYEEGENKNAGKLGKFLVKGTDENGNVIESGVGGFKVSLDSFIDSLNELIDFDKNNLPKNKDQWFRELALKQFDVFKGKIVKIEAQELSKAKKDRKSVV